MAFFDFFDTIFAKNKNYIKILVCFSLLVCYIKVFAKSNVVASTIDIYFSNGPTSFNV
jgi:hypothetical protein